MLIETPTINLVIPVVPGDYTTAPLTLGNVTFTQPEMFTSNVVDEILLQFEHPNSGKPSESQIELNSFTNYSNAVVTQPASLYLPPSIEFFRRFDQWFVTILVEGTGFPFTPFYLYLSHFDRLNRKVYYTRGTLTLSRII